MNFLCPHCQNEFVATEISAQPIQVQCPTCQQLSTVVAPSEPKSGWPAILKIAVVLGTLAIVGLGLMVAVASFLWFRALTPNAIDQPIAQTRVVQKQDQQFEQLSDEYAPFPMPKAKRRASFELAELYVAKFGDHLKSYSSKHPPGCRTRVEVYLPLDLSDDAKIPCVLIAPAGTNLLTGSDCDDLTYTDEILPYIKAGMAVVHYSIDATMVDDERFAERMFPGIFRAFAEAHGGVINGQRAIDFALENFDQIDSDRVYCAGHSSAATLALQLASTDSRISKCAVFAPAPSLKKRFGDFLNQPGLDEQLPMLKQYICNWSPDNRIAKFHCPIFIFHARDDSNTPYRDTKTFCNQLTAAGKEVELVTVRRGGHYQSMIDEGIPAAVRWLSSKTE